MEKSDNYIIVVIFCFFLYFPSQFSVFTIFYEFPKYFLQYIHYQSQFSAFLLFYEFSFILRNLWK